MNYCFDLYPFQNILTAELSRKINGYWLWLKSNFSSSLFNKVYCDGFDEKKGKNCMWVVAEEILWKIFLFFSQTKSFLLIKFGVYCPYYILLSEWRGEEKGSKLSAIVTVGKSS